MYQSSSVRHSVRISDGCRAAHCFGWFKNFQFIRFGCSFLFQRTMFCKGALIASRSSLFLICVQTIWLVWFSRSNLRKCSRSYFRYLGPEFKTFAFDPNNWCFRFLHGWSFGLSLVWLVVSTHLFAFIKWQPVTRLEVLRRLPNRLVYQNISLHPQFLVITVGALVWCLPD